MEKMCRRRGNRPGSVIRAGVVAAACLAARLAPAAGVSKSITRHADPVVVSGKNIPGLSGTSLTHMALYNVTGGAAAPIPFQIDEKDPSGTMSLTAPGGAAVNPDDGLFDANDELVFMSRDLGDRCSKNELPPGCLAAVEIECADPATGDKGWVYLVLFKEPRSEAAPRYMQYDPARDYVTADCYELGYTPGAMKSYFSTLILKNGAGGPSVNVLDRFKFRVDVTFFFSLIAVRRTEDDMTAVLAGYKDGPVRTIRRCNNSLYLKFGIRSPTSVVDNYYYRDSIEWPTLISLPFNVSTIASEAFLRSGCDWNSAATGMGYFNSCNMSPVRVDGFMSEQEKRLDKRPYLWSALSGPQGTLLSRLWLSGSLVMGKELLYIDDETIDDPPEVHKGHWGYNGWLFNVTTVPKGTHKFISYFYFPEHYKQGDEQEYLDILDRPIRTSVRIL